MELIPIAIFWTLLIWGMQRRQPGTHLYMLFGTLPLGSFAVVPIEVTGGLTLTGPPVVASFILLKSFRNLGIVRQYLGSAMRLSRFGLLVIFLGIAFWVTLFSPKFFANRIEVVPMSLKDVGIMGTAMLTPTTQNVSQLLYLTISVLSVFVFREMLLTEASRVRAMKAFRFGAYVTVLTGALDAMSMFVPISPFLDIFRNAGYALATEVVVNGSKRVVGLMPEASAFGLVCLFFLAFSYFSRFVDPTRSLVRKTARVIAIFSLAVLMFLSMSSSAYMGLSVFVLLAIGEWVYRFVVMSPSSFFRRGQRGELLSMLAIAELATILLMASPWAREALSTRVNRLFFEKTSSISYEERSMWTQVSLETLSETNGLGCGLGATRASNKVVSIFSNTGVIGGCVFYAFVAITLIRRSYRGTQEMAIAHAVRWAFPALFVVDLMVGTTPDFGLANAWMFGLVSAVSCDASCEIETSALEEARSLIAVQKKYSSFQTQPKVE